LDDVGKEKSAGIFQREETEANTTPQTTTTTTTKNGDNNNEVRQVGLVDGNGDGAAGREGGKAVVDGSAG